ncbi:MAG: TetR/AcrR family transcriptional regulator, partial [Methylocystis sp.]|nr:TetR/AcrR family transcriptional regulator [Methylocystis sp.]
MRGEILRLAARGPELFENRIGDRTPIFILDHVTEHLALDVDEIARRAGVSKPTLYTHFGDKQALFTASFAR